MSLPPEARRGKQSARPRAGGVVVQGWVKLWWVENQKESKNWKVGLEPRKGKSGTV